MILKYCSYAYVSFRRKKNAFCTYLLWTIKIRKLTTEVFRATVVFSTRNHDGIRRLVAYGIHCWASHHLTLHVSVFAWALSTLIWIPNVTVNMALVVASETVSLGHTRSIVQNMITRTEATFDWASHAFILIDKTFTSLRATVASTILQIF